MSIKDAIQKANYGRFIMRLIFSGSLVYSVSAAAYSAECRDYRTSTMDVKTATSVEIEPDVIADIGLAMMVIDARSIARSSQPDHSASLGVDEIMLNHRLALEYGITENVVTDITSKALKFSGKWDGKYNNIKSTLDESGRALTPYEEWILSRVSNGTESRSTMLYDCLREVAVPPAYVIAAALLIMWSIAGLHSNNKQT